MAAWMEASYPSFEELMRQVAATFDPRSSVVLTSNCSERTLTIVMAIDDGDGDPAGLADDAPDGGLDSDGLRITLAACPEPFIQTNFNFAMYYRHFILFLKLADEFGMINDDLVTLVW